MTKIVKFTHKGLDFEIRATALPEGWRVQVFRNGQSVSPPYTSAHEVATDFAMSGCGDIVDELIATAKDDIENDRLAAVKAAIKAI